jgi:division protein CdvB (Snf7/Vps24/ESCRT-III family)
MEVVTMANPETYRIDLDDIEDVDEDELSEHRPDDLENWIQPI